MPRFNNGFFNNEASGAVPVSTLEEYQENLSDQADDTNTTFVVARSIDESLKVSVNGLIYTEADGNISFNAGETDFTISFAPQSDDIVVAIYSSYE